MAAQPMRIFSYLPNPRIWKAQIAAAYLDVKLEIIGDRPGELTDWLWDVDPRPLADGERDSLADNAVAGSRGFSNPHQDRRLFTATSLRHSASGILR